MSTISSKTDSISVAVITGGHAFDVPGFHAIFRDIPQVDSYIQQEENWAADIGNVRDTYDVLLFYNMPRNQPERESDQSWSSLAKAARASSSFITPFWPTISGPSGRIWLESPIAVSDTTMNRNSQSKSPTPHTRSPKTSSLGRWSMKPTRWPAQIRTATSC